MGRFHKADKNSYSHVFEALHYGLLGAGEGVLPNPARRKAFLEELELWRHQRVTVDACFE